MLVISVSKKRKVFVQISLLNSLLNLFKVSFWFCSWSSVLQTSALALRMASVVCTLRDHQDDINWCAFSAKLLATCSGDKTLRIYNAEDFSELPFSPLKGHSYSVHCCCFSPCGQFLVSCSTDATTLVWSMVTGGIEAVLEHPDRSPVRICALSPNAAHLVSGASDGTLALWDFHSKRLSR